MNTDVYGGKMMTGTMGDGGRERRSLWKTPALITALILVIPLLGNHFVDGWNWRPGGFAILGILIFGIGFTYQLVTRNTDAIAYRAGVGVAFAAGFLLVWANVVQSADVNPDAVMYFGVPIVGIIGAGVARLQPNGMARALFATALAQALVLSVVLILLVNRNPEVTSWTPPELRGFAGNGFLVMLFVGSALLFRKAARGVTSGEWRVASGSAEMNHKWSNIRLASLVFVALGAVGSLVFMFRVGRHNQSAILMTLFTLWVVAPFVAMVAAPMLFKKWSVRGCAWFQVFTIVVALSSTGIYGDVAFGTPRPQPAFMFLVVPFVCLLLVGAASLVVSRGAKGRVTSDG